MSTPPEPSRQSGTINGLPPRVRISARDNHHLLWSRERMRQLGVSEAREVPCAIVNGDSRIHTLTHQYYRQDGLWVPDHAAEFDLQGRCQLVVRRHREGWCSCALPQRLITVNALSLEPLADHEPPCLGHAIDRDILAIMRDFYRPVRLIGAELPRLLEERCRNRQCACALVQGRNPLRPLDWHRDEPMSA
jgi:hypothetical protein